MGYKKSRELGRNKNQNIAETDIKQEDTSILDISNVDVENAEMEGRFYWLNNFVGKATNGTIIQSDLYDQISHLELQMKITVVGLVILNDGSIQLLFEK